MRGDSRYWASLQHANGAFDEAYPNEQCLAATAFTTFYLGDAFLRCRDRLDAGLRARLESTFDRAGTWLCRHDETHGLLSNHLAAAAAALETMRRIVDRPAFSDRARMFVDRILEHQSAEGWLREYDGADIGYGTHGFFYLALYWKMTACERTQSALERAAGFLSHFVHPDGTIGGEYGSRNTEFYYPAGLELFAPVSATAAAIAAGLRPSIAARHVCGVWSMDDFNFMPMLNNVLFACEALQAGAAAAPRLPWQCAPFSKRFDEAGLWVINREAFYAVVGLSKGGTVSVFDKSGARLRARHSGLLATAGSTRITSQDHQLSPAGRWAADGTAVEIVVPWKTLKTIVFTPIAFVAFRLFTLTLGRVPSISQWLKGLLVHVLIRRKSRPAVIHTRRIAILDDGVSIDDDIQLPAGTATLSSAELFTAVHMGSSWYPDARIAGPAGAVRRWAVPSSGRLRLRGRLTIAGATWSAEDA